MSQIFDALLRSETERAENHPLAKTDATELLRHVERQAAPKWTADLLAELSSTVDGLSGSVPSENVPELAAASFKEAAVRESLSILERSDTLNRLQSLSITVSPTGRLVSLTDSESAQAEAFRLLSVRLRDMRKTRSLKRVLITSSTPREGKSTVAANLACALAHDSKEKVLLIEGDLRRPTLVKMFGLGHIPGISEWLQGENDLPSNIYHLKEANLWILPSGRSPATPLELLQSTRLLPLMDQLTALFDWIIIDTPPILPLADTSVWSRMADGILLITRRGVTEKKQLTAALQTVEAGKLIGALLNSSTSSVYKRYYYGTSSTT